MTTDATARALAGQLASDTACRHGCQADRAAQALTVALDRVRDLEAVAREARTWLWCTQCGQWRWERACGPTHAAVFAERDVLVQTLDAALTPPPREPAFEDLKILDPPRLANLKSPRKPAQEEPTL